MLWYAKKRTKFAGTSGKDILLVILHKGGALLHDLSLVNTRSQILFNVAPMFCNILCWASFNPVIGNNYQSSFKESKPLIPKDHHI